VILSQSNVDYYQLKYDSRDRNRLVFEEVKFPTESKKCIRYIKVKKSNDISRRKIMYSDGLSKNEGNGSGDSIQDGDRNFVNDNDNCNFVCSNNSINDTNSNSIRSLDSFITADILVVLKCSKNFSMLQKESEMLTFLHLKFLEENLSTNADNAGSRSGIDLNIENMIENDEIPMSLRLKDSPFIQHAFDNFNVVTFEKVCTKRTIDVHNTAAEPETDDNDSRDIKDTQYDQVGYTEM
jgi:hypothetical protein